MTQLTNEFIISQLSQKLTYYSAFVEAAWGIAIVAIVIGIILLFIKKLRGYGIGAIILAVMMMLSTFAKSDKEDYIKYSINNNTWSVVTDTIVDKEHKKIKGVKSKYHNYYYIYLKELGKVSVSKGIHNNNYEGHPVYVVLLEDETGKKHVSDLIYSQHYYTYNNENEN